MGNCAKVPSEGGAGGSAGVGSTSDDTSWAKVPRSPLRQADILNRAERKEDTISVAGKTIWFGSVCFRGYYPDTPSKANQDAMGILEPTDMSDENKCLFGVFDGHGQTGDACAQFAKKEVLKNLKDLKSGADISSALTKHFQDANTALHKSSIDDTLSGTTAVVALFDGGTIWVGNVGDSRAVLFQKNGNKPLSNDQTPYRRDERNRVKKAGARVMNMDMLEGLMPVHDDWDVTLGEEVDEDGDPPRIWAPDGSYPGTAFTRSIGDSVAEDLGVTAEPEIDSHTLTASDLLLIVASDGIWEFLTNQAVFDIAKHAKSPQEAAQQLWRKAFQEWLSKEVRTDDITVIVVDLGGFYGSPGVGGNLEMDSSEGAVPATGKKAGGKPTRRGSTKNEMNLKPQGV